MTFIWLFCSMGAFRGGFTCKISNLMPQITLFYLDMAATSVFKSRRLLLKFQPCYWIKLEDFAVQRISIGNFDWKLAFRLDFYSNHKEETLNFQKNFNTAPGGGFNGSRNFDIYLTFIIPYIFMLWKIGRNLLFLHFAS